MQIFYSWSFKTYRSSSYKFLLLKLKQLIILANIVWWNKNCWFLFILFSFAIIVNVFSIQINARLKDADPYKKSSTLGPKTCSIYVNFGLSFSLSLCLNAFLCFYLFYLSFISICFYKFLFSVCLSFCLSLSISEFLHYCVSFCLCICLFFSPLVSISFKSLILNLLYYLSYFFLW